MITRRDMIQASVATAVAGAAHSAGVVTMAGPRLYVASEASSGVFFEPDIDGAANVNSLFDDHNGTPAATLSTTIVRAGHTQSIRLEYDGDEAGIDLIKIFPSTASLFTRKYEYFDANWATNWPVGLKTARYFTRDDLTTGAEPDAYAYCSEKLVWQTYAGDPDDLYGRGYNNAIFNLDLEGTYDSGVLFGNGLPYIRPEHWYRMETWMVLNSAPDVADGIMQIKIDGQFVCNRTNVAYRSTVRGIPNGTGWQSMWFGGNYSGATFGGPSATLYRYMDGLYLSTTADWAS